jgi:hypothetical protein
MAETGGINWVPPGLPPRQEHQKHGNRASEGHLLGAEYLERNPDRNKVVTPHRCREGHQKNMNRLHTFPNFLRCRSPRPTLPGLSKKAVFNVKIFKMKRTERCCNAIVADLQRNC